MAPKSDQLSPNYLQEQAQDGWWPYFVGREPSLESTALCAIACRKNAELAKRSLEFLLSSQNQDGGWSTTPKSQPSDWTSGLAMIAVQILRRSLLETGGGANEALLARADKAINDGTIHLLRSRADLLNEFTRVSMYLINGTDFDYPRGWSWSPNTNNWVEPTAYAVLAIKMSPKYSEKRYQLAVKEAQKYFLEKSCHPAGWNYGTPKSMEANLPYQPVPTAWALIAMNGLSDPIIESALKLLQQSDDVMLQTMQAQALSCIALNAHGININDRLEKLNDDADRHASGSGSLFIAALATIATQIPSEGNPFVSDPKLDTARGKTI